MRIFLLIVVAIVSYLLGSLNGQIIISKYVLKAQTRKKKIYKMGYGKFMDNYGTKGLALLIIFDVLKSVVAVMLGSLLLGIVDEPNVGKAFAAFCLLLGHAFPLLFMFQGCKGALCAGVMLFFVDWRVALCCWAVYVLVLVFTRYAAFSCLVAALLTPVFMWIFEATPLEGALTAFCALILAIRYAENVVRIFGGTEPQIITAPKRSSDIDEYDEF